MPVVAADLLDPKGPLQPALFPSDDSTALTTRLTGYISQNTTATGNLTGTTLDQTVTEYALYKAYSAVRTRIMSNPADVSFEGEGAQKYSDFQLEEISRWADQHLANFQAIVAGTGAVEAPLLPPTMSTENIVSA